MRIVFISANPFPNYAGGIENWLANIVPSLRERGISLFVISPGSSGPIKYDAEKLRGCKFVRTPEFPKLVKNTLKVVRLFLGKKISLIEYSFEKTYWIWATVRAIVRLHDKKKNTSHDTLIVGLHTVPAMIPVFIAKCLRGDIRSIAYARGRVGDDLVQMGRPNLAKFYLYLERITLSSSDAIFANGYDTQAYLRKLTSQAISVIPNGVDYARFNSGSRDLGHAVDTVVETVASERSVGRLIVTCVGTLRDVKGVREVLHAAALFKEHFGRTLGRDVKFVFVGKGDEAPYIQLASRLDVADSVLFTGETLHVPQVLGLSDVALAVSGGGGFSNAAIEMMAAGCAIVGWDSDVYRQLFVHGQTAHMVEFGNALRLAEGIKLLLTNESYRISLSLNAATAAQAYDWSRMSDRFLSNVSAVHRVEKE